MDNRDLIKRDLAAILKFDEQIDYSQKPIVEKYYKYIMEKGLLTTPYGKRYIKRLEQILSGGNVDGKCIFCDAQAQKDTVLCSSCMAKLKPPAAVYCRSCGSKMPADSASCPACGKGKEEGYKYCAHCGKEVPMPNMEALADNVKNKSKELAEQAAKITKENVQDIAGKGMKLAGKSKEALEQTNIKEIGGKVKQELGKHSKKKVSMWIVLILGILSVVGALSKVGGGGGAGYEKILGMDKSAVEKQYGAPLGPSEGIINCYLYSDRSTVGYDENDKAIIVSLAGGDGKIMGLQVGDNRNTVDKTLKKYKCKFVDSTEVSDGRVSDRYSNSKYRLVVSYSGQTIILLTVMHNK